MTDTNQLPEPELGYIKTDKSNQPAFSARQMREAMLICGAQNAESDPQAPLSLTAAPQQATTDDMKVYDSIADRYFREATQTEVTDAQLTAAYLAWCKTNGTPESFARAILALRPQAMQARAQVQGELSVDQMREMLSVHKLAIVPMRATHAMLDAMSDDDWQWSDLLAAAEAITEDEHDWIDAAPQPAQATQAVDLSTPTLRELAPDLGEAAAPLHDAQRF